MYYAASTGQKLSRLETATWTKIVSRDLGYPCLRAKAAETRHVIEFCLQLAHRHRTGDGPGGRSAYNFPIGSRLAYHQAEHADLLVNLFEGLARYTRSLTAQPWDPEETKQGMYTYLQSLARLHRLWREGVAEAYHSAMPFALRPKAHLLHHLVEDKMLLWGNPARFWNYRDEDWVGAVKVIAAKTRDPRTLEERVLEKLRLRLGLNIDA